MDEWIINLKLKKRPLTITVNLFQHIYAFQLDKTMDKWIINITLKKGI
jgi:hypothetical protein